MCGGSLGARDLAELSRPLHPLPWLLSPSQLTALLTSDGALVNVLQFGWKGDHITVHESVLSEDRLLVAFLTESLQVRGPWEGGREGGQPSLPRGTSGPALPCLGSDW